MKRFHTLGVLLTPVVIWATGGALPYSRAQNLMDSTRGLVVLVASLGAAFARP